MPESERLERYKRAIDEEDRQRNDEVLTERIRQFLNDDRIDKYCMVDAYYYDFSVIPEPIREKESCYRDMYLLYGITTEGEIRTKWVERYDLDCQNPIVDGECIPDVPLSQAAFVIPEIKQFFDATLLSTPTPQLISMFACNPESVKPESNEIDVRDMDLCEDCKSKFVNEMKKAFHRSQC